MTPLARRCWIAGTAFGIWATSAAFLWAILLDASA